jgi:hypothetical protein
MILSNLSITVTHELIIEWDIRQGSKNALDYITSVDQLQPHSQFVPSHSQETVNPLEGLAGTFTGPSMFAIPVPIPTLGGQPQASFAALPAAKRVMWIYNGAITELAYINNADGNLGDLAATQSATRLRIRFTASSSNVVIAWGGHIASASDWSAGNSASSINGSPYHTRLFSLDGSGGNQDRSLAADAVLTCNHSLLLPFACLLKLRQQVAS